MHESPLNSERWNPSALIHKRGLSLQQLKTENSRLLHEEIESRKTVYRALPEVITLNHTDICNLECIMCPRGKKKGRHRLPRRALEHIIMQLFPTARKATLTTSGGEPLAVDFDFLLEHAIRYEVKLEVVTNGVLLTPELYDRAKQTLDHLNVSCDSHIPEVYEYIRRGARFDRLRDNLMGISDTRRASPDSVLFSLSAVVMRSNLPHLAGFVRFAKEMGADGIVFQRARKELNPTPEELPHHAYSPQQILEYLDEAGRTASDVGINLYLSDLNLPNIVTRPLRAKIPEAVEGKGLCWFLAQNFSIMYTGDVFPCCVFNDYCLGNVLYQDVMDIWNGRKMVALRTAHLTGRGTIFCSGCPHAPHLPARYPSWMIKPIQKARMISRHFRNKLKHRYAPSYAHPIFDPPVPAHKICDGRFERDHVPTKTEPFRWPVEIIARNPHDDSLWFTREGAVYRSDGIHETPELLIRFKTPPAPISTCLHLLDPQTALVAFNEDGKLFRLTIGPGGADSQEVLTLSDPRAFIRGTVVRTPAGTLWAGEYGVFPGARRANLYRSRDEGRTFEKVWRFPDAKHIHALYIKAGDGQLLATTGDLARERRLYIGSGDGRPFRTVQHAWAGFTAIAETDHFIHLGTDLEGANGFLRYPLDLSGLPEYRPLPGDLDLPIRQIFPLGGGRLLALGVLDRNQIDHLEDRYPTLFLSDDEGASWKAIQPFAKEWNEMPEYIMILDRQPLVLVSISPHNPLILEINA